MGPARDGRRYYSVGASSPNRAGAGHAWESGETDLSEARSHPAPHGSHAFTVKMSRRLLCLSDAKRATHTLALSPQKKHRDPLQALTLASSPPTKHARNRAQEVWAR